YSRAVRALVALSTSMSTCLPSSLAGAQVYAHPVRLVVLMCSSFDSDRPMRLVEPVTDRLARGGRDWRRAGEPCKGRLGADPCLVRPGEHELCGRMRSNTWLVEQSRGELASDRFDLACELAFLSGQLHMIL